MSRIIRYALLGLVGLVIIALALPFLIPVNSYRERIAEEASRTLHRDVVLAGDLSLQILPSLQITARDVSLANADGFGETPMAEMAEMRVGVKLIPLLSSDVQITEFVLIDPVIRLQQNRSGNNWTFRSPDAPTTEMASSGEGFVRRPGALPFEASFGDVRIENASIHFEDGQQQRDITGLTLQVSLPSLDEEAAISGQLTADGERLSFDGAVGSIRGVFEGAETQVTMEFGGNLVSASFDGRLAASEAFELDGEIDANIPSLRNLATFAGAELPPGDRLQAFAAQGSIDVAPGNVRLVASNIRFDDISGSGRLNIATSGARPNITGALDLPNLDVTPYLPEQTSGSDAENSNAGIPPWSEDEIDLAGLNLVDADLDLNVGLFEYGDIDIENVRLDVTLDRGRMVANLSDFQLYDGTGSVRVVANNRTATPSYSVNAQLSDLNALPFLQAAAGFERLTGTGGIALDLQASGASQAAIMRSLAGNGNFGFEDGAIVGINLAETIRNVNSFFGAQSSPQEAETSSDDSEQVEAGDQTQTDFSSLSGSFTINGGRADNTDFAMLSPLLRVGGSGFVDLPSQSLDYRMRPRLVASIEGQGGAADLRGVEIPVRIRGGFNDISIGVDTSAVGQALISGALSSALGGNSDATRPEDVLRDSLLDAIGLGGNDAQQQDGEEEQPEADPAQQLLQGLFNRGRRDEDESGDDNN
ncbi:AsmA family protein [Maricaulis sp. MIT060901]|uniref:AsmA family protein n=1 Tax=Maricaulis sp. MIT060901 TaxID=3096993 RepID=UPI00399C3AEF